MLLLPLLLCLTSVIAQICFNPDGTVATDAFVCDPSGASKHCCMNNSTCLSNCLCLYATDSSINTGFCTESSWDDPSCFQQCRDGWCIQISYLESEKSRRSLLAKTSYGRLLIHPSPQSLIPGICTISLRAFFLVLQHWRQRNQLLWRWRAPLDHVRRTSECSECHQSCRRLYC